MGEGRGVVVREPADCRHGVRMKKSCRLSHGVAQSPGESRGRTDLMIPIDCQGAMKKGIFPVELPCGERAEALEAAFSIEVSLRCRIVALHMAADYGGCARAHC